MQTYVIKKSASSVVNAVNIDTATIPFYSLRKNLSATKQFNEYREIYNPTTGSTAGESEY